MDSFYRWVRSLSSHVVYVLQETKEPLPVDQMNAIWETCKDDGVLLGKGGLYGSVCIHVIAFHYFSEPLIL